MDPKKYLENLEIKFNLYTHKAVFTATQAKMHCSHIKGIHCKNLFLKNKNKKKFYLVVIPGNKNLDLSKLNEILDDRLGFASSQRLQKVLNLTPGSVSPFGLINDKEKKTTLVIDKEVWDSEIVTFHPNINTETLQLSQSDFRKYIYSLKINLIIFD